MNPWQRTKAYFGRLAQLDEKEAEAAWAAARKIIERDEARQLLGRKRGR